MSAGTSKTKPLARALLKWFAREARDLPWRRTRDPYAIWVSEIMLQQTQVETVRGYWERWMAAFPTVHDLASAKAEKVLKLWEGLGYYSRARNLHRAAQIVVARHRGQMPVDFSTVLALPGIGRYTAGAICSIAFNQPTPVLDGNVLRVLTRVFGISADPRKQPTNRGLWELAQELVLQASREKSPSQQQCSHLNQALMELGAVVCTPTAPTCTLCSIKQHCSAWGSGSVDLIPLRRRRVPTLTKETACFVVEDRGKFLVEQRPARGINANLWQFPSADLEPRAQHDLDDLSIRVLGFRPSNLHSLGLLRHSITHHRIQLHVWRAECPKTMSGLRKGLSWRTKRELERLPFTGTHRRIIRWL
jgi:A/G-specific adenine glycosylase